MVGKEGQVLRIITAYRVVANQFLATAGPRTAFRQQRKRLHASGIEKPNPRAQVLMDLANRIAVGEDVVLMIDANESLNDSWSEFSKFVRRTKLIDIVGQRHGTIDEPATHTKGTERIDHVLMSEGISEFVIATGILEFEEFCNSDHRAIYADVDMDAFMGGQPSPMESQTNRGVSSHDPRAVAVYRKCLESRLNEEKLEAELEKLLADIRERGMLDKKPAREADRLQEKFAEIKLESEAACKGIKSAPWSPRLRRARQYLRYWKLWANEIKLSIDLEKKMRSIETELELKPKTVEEGTGSEEAQTNKNGRERIMRAQLTLPTLAVATAEIRKARKYLKRVLNDAKQLRQDHSESRAEVASKEGSAEKEKAIRMVIQAEQQQHAWSRMRRAMGKGKKSGLSSILVEKKDGTTDRITDKAGMEEKLIEQFQKHYSQADGTPFTRSPLTDILGRYGTTEEASWLFDGTFTISDDTEIDEATKSILRKLKRQDGTRDVCDHITADKDTQNGESPRQLHLLDCTWGTRRLCYEWKETRQKKGKSTYRKEYKRWEKIINATIKKIPGTPLLHKLRVIHLIESDFNLMIGIGNRRMMWGAEENENLGTEQKGSRKGQEAISLVVEKQAKFSISRMARTNIASLDNDAKSCFDRIVMLVALLCAQRQGMSA
jgi:hypothetical protein